MLWVDPATGALESLEYGYTGLRRQDFGELAGGYARFEQLADGKWVVRQWLIRMPRFGVRTTPLGPARDLIPAGMIETGGELIRAYDTSGVPVTQRAGQSLIGRIIPSDLGVPLGSPSVVHLSGTTYRTTVGSDGSFTISDLPAGRYLAAFHHPRVDTLGIAFPVRAFAISDAPVVIDLGIPKTRSVLDEVCPDRSGDAIRVLLVSTTRRDGTPLSRQRVQLRVVRTGEVHEQRTTDPDGRARFCGLPPNELLEIRLLGANATSVTLDVTGAQFVRRDIRAGG